MNGNWPLGGVDPSLACAFWKLGSLPSPGLPAGFCGERNNSQNRLELGKGAKVGQVCVR